MTDVIEDRKVAALERIATALEQMALNAIPVDALPTGEPPLPTPPPDLPVTPIMQPLPPVQPAPFQFTGPPAQCPTHHVAWKVVPAGVSKKTGKPYDKFLVCAVQGCEERPRA